MKLLRLSLSAIISLILSSLEPALAQTAEDFLPPELPWDGKSVELILEADAEWVTPAEKSGLTTTPRYLETVSWLERLVARRGTEEEPKRYHPFR